MRSLPLLLLLLLPSAACWSPQSFAPRERMDAEGPGGVPAALYPIPAARADAPSTAEVRVWSHGAQARFTADDREITELHIGFELENNGGAPLQLDLGAVTCEELMLDGLLQPVLQPVRMEGNGTALPGQTARVDVLFEPATTHPRDITTFRIRFVVREGDPASEREALRQVVPFGPWTRPREYDPYWSGAYGWGWGWGWNAGYGPGFGWSSRPYW